MHVTIREVAKEASVSISTVSRYINSPNMLSDEIHAKVKLAIDRLNFKPNPLAVSMRTNKTNNIAVIIPTITNMYYVDLYESIYTIIHKEGYRVSLFTTDYDKRELYRYFEAPFRYLYDGVILAFLDEQDTWEKIKEIQSQIPVVVITSDPKHTETNNIFIDAYDAIYQATAYLINKGKHKIGYIGAVKKSIISLEKERGFIDALKNAGRDVDYNYIFNGERQHFLTGVKGVEYFAAKGAIPDGIVCSTDDVGIGCIKRLVKFGVSVPEQTSVIGFNGISILDSYEPELTTIAQPIKDIAESATSLLMSRIVDGSAANRRVCFKGTLKEGNSSK